MLITSWHSLHTFAWLVQPQNSTSKPAFKLMQTELPPTNRFAARFRASSSNVLDFKNCTPASVQKALGNKETLTGETPAHCLWVSSLFFLCGCHIACHVRKCMGVSVSYELRNKIFLGMKGWRTVQRATVLLKWGESSLCTRCEQSNGGTPVPFSILFPFCFPFPPYRPAACALFSHVDEPVWTADGVFRLRDSNY